MLGIKALNFSKNFDNLICGQNLLTESVHCQIKFSGYLLFYTAH